mmetsp:Transcript_7955/g.14410  ORF Transcript_7955/g.14410 Transcript_7955/m.14410 type:complete len:90 (-) Transcript_7955:520-789(-)
MRSNTDANCASKKSTGHEKIANESRRSARTKGGAILEDVQPDAFVIGESEFAPNGSKPAPIFPGFDTIDRIEPTGFVRRTAAVEFDGWF